MQTKLEQAYIECLELAKANAFKVMICIDTHYTEYGDSFGVTIRNKHGGNISLCGFFSFSTDEEIDSELEKVKNLIKESL